MMNPYERQFNRNLEFWISGLESYPGEIFPGLVHGVLQRMGRIFHGALEHDYEYDLLGVATRISKAVKYLVHEQEIAFGIVAQFPPPERLREGGQSCMKRLIRQVETEYGPVVDRLERKWEFERVQSRMNVVEVDETDLDFTEPVLFSE